jgi:hypothetical protein
VPDPSVPAALVPARPPLPEFVFTSAAQATNVPASASSNKDEDRPPCMPRQCPDPRKTAQNCGAGKPAHSMSRRVPGQDT